MKYFTSLCYCFFVAVVSSVSAHAGQEPPAWTVDQLYDRFMYRVWVHCPDILTYGVVGRSIDLPPESGDKKTAEIELYLNKNGTLTYIYSEHQIVDDCNKSRWMGPDGCYNISYQNTQPGTWRKGPQGELIVDGIGQGTPPQVVETGIISHFKFATDLKSLGLKGQTVTLFSVVGDLGYEPRSKFCPAKN